MMLLAHSADPKKNIPAQSYAAHIKGTLNFALEAATQTASFAEVDGNVLLATVRQAVEYHDLGKLASDNQSVLAGERRSKRLPVQHTDAGTAYLLNKLYDAPSAVLVRSHHIGLPDFVQESNREDISLFRDDDVRAHVDETLDELIKLHRHDVHGLKCSNDAKLKINGESSLFFRIALSCLADGDHFDTATHYGQHYKYEKPIKLRAEERLEALDKYISGLDKNDDDRSRLRDEMYFACRNAVPDANISSCDSPVGSGKTTALMAHLLTQANKRKLRRIIIVLPYTNIITQSVEIYRKALVLPGENPKDVVAELHHRADFEDLETRHFTALWMSPIIVTTAVAFFETLASNKPATLRRLHNLPGCAIFIDESHAALPAKLLPLAWHWIKVLANEWQCYWVLASGSLNRFWEIPEIDKNTTYIPEILPSILRYKLQYFEKNRINYCYKREVQNIEELVPWLDSLPGPRIVILNTVQSAAVLAYEYSKRFGRKSVEHISTALTPRDRASSMMRIKSRLKNSTSMKDENWTLFATSCVEAGMDISFRTGVRELGTFVSLLQTAGRVNRQGQNSDAHVWTVKLSENGLLKHNPAVRDAAKVLQEIYDSGMSIMPSLCTEALKREIRAAGNFKDMLLADEVEMRFPQIDEKFKVIASDTRLTVVDKELANRVENCEFVSWRDIQQGSVQIWGYRLEQLSIPEICGRERIYKWIYEYNEFLGYMAGILPVLQMGKFGGAII